MLTATKGPSARALSRWAARAKSSLPVPGSPSDEDGQHGARGLLEIAEEGEHRGIAGDDAEPLAVALQALELGVAERRLANLGARRAHAMLQLVEPSARALFLRARRRELRPQRLLAAGRPRHGGSRRFQILLERLDRRFLTHEAFPDRRDLALEVTDSVGRSELVPEERGRRGNRHRHEWDRQRRQEADQQCGAYGDRDVAERQRGNRDRGLPPSQRQSQPGCQCREQDGIEHGPHHGDFTQPGAVQSSVEQIRMEEDPTGSRVGLDEDEHDPVGDQILERFRLARVDRRPDVGELDDLGTARPRRACRRGQHLSVSIDRDPIVIHVRERAGQRQAVRGHSSISDPDEERRAPHDSIGIGRGQSVPDTLGVLRESRKRSGQRPVSRQVLGRPGQWRPRAVLRRRGAGAVTSGRGDRVGGLERDREHHVLREGDRLTEERIAGGAAAAGRARLLEGSIEADDRGPGLRQARDETSEHRAIPDAGTQPGFSRRVANDDDGRPAPGLPDRQALVQGPLERGDRRASRSRHAGGYRGRGESDHRGQRHGPHGGVGP